MERMTVLEPLEHSVLQEARNDGPTVGRSVLEPLEHSVPDVTQDWVEQLLSTMAVPDLLEHSDLGVTDGAKPGMMPPEPLEHSVLVAPQDERDVSVAGVDRLDPIEHSGVVRRTEMSVRLPRDAGWHATTESSGMIPTVPSGSATWVDSGGQTALPGEGGPKLGPDVREDDLVLGAAVLLPAENMYQATISQVEVRVSACDVTTDGDKAAGLVNWNTGEIFWTSMRLLMTCLCIMVVIGTIWMIQIGMIRMQSQVRRMWKTIILTFQRGWT